MRSERKLCFWMLTGVAVVALTLSATPVRADWNPGDPALWVQLPDLNPTGIDIDSDGCSILADDFACSFTGKITDFHIWGSWLNDVNGGVASIRLQFYSNDMSGPFSKPGDLLWTNTVGPAGAPGFDGVFTERLYQTMPAGQTEAFWKPNSDPVPTGTDTQIWQYNLTIDPNAAFFQQGSPTNPITYWVEVLVVPINSATDFGWKTRDPNDGHYADDAVFFDTVSSPPGWAELKYPVGHPLFGESVDMAFVITPEPMSWLMLATGAMLCLRRRD